MSAHVIVWNLETVPDFQGFAAANDLEARHWEVGSEGNWTPTFALAPSLRGE